MKLEIGNFYVEDIKFGDSTNFKDGILTINKDEALNVVREDKHITDADIKIVKPGDKVRLVPVKEAIEPRYRMDEGPLFPGVTGNLQQVGDGMTMALKGTSVLVVGKHWGGFQDGLIDMAGEGAKYTYFSQLKNIVLVADTDEEFEKREQQKKNKALRWAGMRLAEYIGRTVSNQDPDEIEEYELDPITK
ncbi:MAG: glycine/sarcosine/betaine reductase component B subunit, partial [Bacillota bacterium]